MAPRQACSDPIATGPFIAAIKSGSVATFGHWPPVICERESTYLSGGNFEQSGDEFRLGLDVTTANVPNLPLKPSQTWGAVGH
jgi:hypothetical protein